MKKWIAILLILLMLAGCGPRPTSSPTATVTLVEPSLTATNTPIAPPPSITPSLTASSLPAYTPIATLSVSPTPVPGWKTYTNEFLGYSFNYPVGTEFGLHGAGGIDANQPLPPGFTSTEYMDYIRAILPGNLCTIAAIPGASIAITPPYTPFGSFVAPCPGMGIGDAYRLENASETWYMAGREISDWMGTKLFLKSDDSFYGEFYVFVLENGFRVIYNGLPRGEMSAELYSAQRSTAQEMLATLHWYRTPDMTLPGSTCAGKSTRLLVGLRAKVTGLSTDLPDRVRAEPSLTSEILTQIYPGALVEILEGPVCADGLVFWRVTNTLIPGGSGWTAEGDGQTYWLEPVKQ